MHTKATTFTPVKQDLTTARVDRHRVHIDVLTKRGWSFGNYTIHQVPVAGTNARGATMFVLQKEFDDTLEGTTYVTDTYIVELWDRHEKGGRCTCKDFEHRNRECKHIRGLRQLHDRQDLLDANGNL